ncbi:MAG: hypothetical protein ACLGGX_06115 [Bdellovibrionia bacterium]
MVKNQLVIRFAFIFFGLILAPVQVYAQSFFRNDVPLRAAWVNLQKKSYCATPDRSIFMRAEETTNGDVYLFVRSKNSAEVQYYLIDEAVDLHVYRRISPNAVNFPFFLESSQLFNDQDRLVFKEKGGRVIRSFNMRFSYHEVKKQACQ